MKILLSGSSGLVGSALHTRLTADGHEIIRLVRDSKAQFGPQIVWNPEAGALDPGVLRGIEAVIHLAGEPIAGRWTSQKKEAIRDSRVLSTSVLSRAIAAATDGPQTFLCASAIGIYGNRDTQILTEASQPGTGFLADVCTEWEAATQPAAATGARVVNLRFAVVLSAKGGALKQMLPTFRKGFGGKLGSGNQYMSWIALDDAVGAICFLLEAKRQTGPVNIASPNPITNADFTKALGHALNRPALLPVPAFALRMLFGDMADEALLASARVTPARLRDAGFKFQYPELEPALNAALMQTK